MNQTPFNIEMLRRWTKNARLQRWLFDRVQLLKPSHVVMCSGTAEENRELLRAMVRQGTLRPLVTRPNSFLARSSVQDVARVESRTFICSECEADAGPLNNWRAPDDMDRTLAPLLDGAMRGRTMYVVPFSMAPVRSPFAIHGVQVTDSPYVVVNTRIMTHGMGAETLRAIDDGAAFVPCTHSVGSPLASDDASDVAWPCNPDNRYIVHYPDRPEVVSYGSGYGGNALLGKKCLALRIASVIARRQGWLAEHMLVVTLIDPQGRKFNVCGCFPSACGKTNLAMLESSLPGWQVRIVGDEIAWLRFGDDGRLYAVNPENGMFGVAPGTSARTNVNAVRSLERDCIFTNVAYDEREGDVWWEGLSARAPEHCVDWRNRDGERRRHDAADAEPWAHPNSRFTAPLSNCPIESAERLNESGVPIDAILFGGRRRDTLPLVLEARDWTHGTYIGATLHSEQTAAAEGTVGALRHDPMSMRPFIGYNAGDYFAHWLRIADEAPNKDALPRIFLVNWFRRDDKGRFLWPGFGDNIRVLDWITKRCAGEADGVATPIGILPPRNALNTSGLGISDADMDALLSVEHEKWYKEIERHRDALRACGDRVPDALWIENRRLQFALAADQHNKSRQASRHD